MTRRRTLALLLLPVAAFAQRRGRSGSQSGQKSTGQGGATPGELLARFTGTLKGVSRKEVLLEVSEDQQLVFRRVKQTRFYDGEKEAGEKSAPLGQPVVIEGRRELNGDLDAIHVIWNEPPKPQPER